MICYCFRRRYHLLLCFTLLRFATGSDSTMVCVFLCFFLFCFVLFCFFFGLFVCLCFFTVSDSAILCCCVQRCHGLALGFVTVPDSGMVCQCVRQRYVVLLCPTAPWFVNVSDSQVKSSQVKIFFNDGSLSKHFTCFFTSSHHNNKL